MKFELSKFHLLCIVSMTFSRSFFVSSGKINIDRKMEKTSTRVVCLSLVAHKYIDNRMISHEEM